MSPFPHFSQGEFVLCTPSCKLQDMNYSFMERLEKARSIAGVPFRLNSAFRTRSYELSKGRSGNSLHCLGRAVDIQCLDSVSRFKIVSSLIAVGFTGIGVSKSFIHVDDRNGDSLVFLYPQC